MIKISPNNTKLGNIPSFSFPSITSCPGATTECKAICYAHKIERIYKNAAKAYESNLQATVEVTFKESLLENVKKITSKKNATKVFRWNVSGDIPNIDVLYQMKEVMEQLPDVTFYAYTRNWALSDWQPHLSKVKELSNFTLFASIDDEHIRNNVLPDATYRIAYVGFKSLSDIARLTGKKLITCSNQLKGILCDKCKYCFNPKLTSTTNSVYFIKH